MATYYSNDFRAGLKIMLDGEPYAVEASEFVKPGKGQAFARVKLRRLLTGTRVEKTFKSTDSAEGADVVDMNLTYLYNDGEFWHFMNNETFEQLSADAKAIGDNAKWLLDQAECIVTLWNGQPIAVTPPNFVELEIIETDPGLKGDTAGTGGQPATLSNEAVVKSSAVRSDRRSDQSGYSLWRICIPREVISRHDDRRSLRAAPLFSYRHNEHDT